MYDQQQQRIRSRKMSFLEAIRAEAEESLRDPASGEA